jgi:hypothetical protein
MSDVIPDDPSYFEPMVKIHSGTLPKPFLDLAIEKNIQKALWQCKYRNYIAQDASFNGSREHFKLVKLLKENEDELGKDELCNFSQD